MCQFHSDSSRFFANNCTLIITIIMEFLEGFQHIGENDQLEEIDNLLDQRRP
jgi:hypothetical protein